MVTGPSLVVRQELWQNLEYPGHFTCMYAHRETCMLELSLEVRELVSETRIVLAVQPSPVVSTPRRERVNLVHKVSPGPGRTSRE